MTDPTDDHILFERRGALGLVTLNRPRQLNALTQDMALRMEDALRLWAQEDGVAVVAIVGAGDRAFCAGGDIKAIYEVGQERGLESWRFYGDEYRMNALIHEYPKPYVAFMDGVTMGGGAGVSVHGSHRIAGDRTLFAMPECGIGLFPDVGASWFLPRLPGETGMWMALTGARLGPADAVAAGLCDLFIPSSAQADALTALAKAEYGSSPYADVDRVLAGFAAEPGAGDWPALRPAIDRCFAGDSVEDALAALRAEGSDWARAQLAELAQKSPTSLRLTFREMRDGRLLSFRDCMRLEYALARFCLTRPDFYEGTRAAVIDKGSRPVWSPATLGEVTPATVAEAFAPLPPGLDLKF
ncbi:MAG: enoyl-CoA hydratase/isomerase family protein [Rubrimonas sp.]|uniref:enoyl-CoA hydratase/isomerase family protein n=1 Tax=Rubrimonas sp. TaxID=2036015 RepID=UPI002FDEDFA8